MQRGNQDLKGKKEAFAGFRDTLAREIRGALPECEGEVLRVLRGTSAGFTDGDGDGDGDGGMHGDADGDAAGNGSSG